MSKLMKFTYLLIIVLAFGVITSCEEDEPKCEKNNKELDVIANINNDQLVFVQGGSFMMGATPEQDNYYINELPVHKVALDSYYIGKYEVTQELWQYVMNYEGPAADGTYMEKETHDAILRPWWQEFEYAKRTSSDLMVYYSRHYIEGDKYPVFLVSKNKIDQHFIPRLNAITGKNYRLPTEAEWEYAARGGCRSKGYKYAGSDDIEKVAWYKGNAATDTIESSWGVVLFLKPHEVGTKLPNELGIYDMSGNVWEWCSDEIKGYSLMSSDNQSRSIENLVIRGGSMIDTARDCRISRRTESYSNLVFCELGFRLAHDAE
ncbi:MAG: formylglycine-generating enzyme family protein [Muribaculaceae bacterium]|nr:formylglycine-generating enzyme family protein [Muribaculaceae bacterium]